MTTLKQKPTDDELKTQLAIDLNLIRDWDHAHEIMPCWIMDMLTKIIEAGWRKP